MKKTWMLVLFTLLLLTAAALAADCAICGGDLICDTCGGLGFQMIFSSATGQFEQTLCGSSCVNGDCPVCTESGATSSAEPSVTYIAPVVGKGGLLVMPPHEYNSALTRPNIRYSESYYEYGYNYQDSVKALLIGYAEALVATGYYTMESYQYSGSHWYRTLRYIGPEPHTQKTDADYLAFEPVYAIVIGRVGSSIGVYYCYDVVTTDASDNKNNGGTRSDYDTRTKCTYCGGDGDCNECGGDMWVWKDKWVYINGLPELVTSNEMCDGIYCTGGSCSKCGGDGWID